MLLTEKLPGICNDGDIVTLDIANISIVKEMKDLANVIITFNDKTYQTIFIR